MVLLFEKYTNFCFDENQSLSGTILAEQLCFQEEANPAGDRCGKPRVCQKQIAGLP